MLLVVPVFAAAALVGTDLADVVLRQFSGAEAQLVIELFLILCVNVVWGLINTVPYAALVAVGRYVALAFVTAGVVIAQVLLALLAGALDSVWLLAASVPISTAVTVVSVLLIVSRGYAALAGPRLLVIVVGYLGAGAAAFGVPYLGATALGVPAAHWVALAAGLAVYALVVARVPAEREIAARLVATLPRPGVRAATHR